MSGKAAEKREAQRDDAKLAIRGERYYVWLDANGVRCGPRHGTLKAAINYKLYWEPLPEKNSDGYYVVNDRVLYHPTQWMSQRENYPSQEPPFELKVAELILRDLEPEEREAFEQVQSLKDRGLV